MKTRDVGHNANREHIVTVAIFQKVASQLFVELGDLQQQTLFATRLHRSKQCQQNIVSHKVAFSVITALFTL
jgi:hypothetical protein